MVYESRIVSSHALSSARPDMVAKGTYSINDLILVICQSIEVFLARILAV